MAYENERVEEDPEDPTGVLTGVLCLALLALGIAGIAIGFASVSSLAPWIVTAGILTVALAFVIINIVVDLLYVLINPRIRSV